VDNWLRHVQDVRDKHEALLKSLDNEVERTDRLCELNVIEQVLNVCQTSIVRDAWQRGQELTVHSWIYGLHDGIIRDLGMAVGSWKEVEKAHRKAVDRIRKPKAEDRKNSEDRNPKAALRRVLKSGFAASAFGLASDFALRISDLFSLNT
jgi:hypothetical protein